MSGQYVNLTAADRAEPRTFLMPYGKLQVNDATMESNNDLLVTVFAWRNFI